jgi:condensin complex subunit 1
MDNPVFVKLEAILRTSQRSPQWFGMAEQALNTIYLLGQQPDALCSEIVKTLTTKVFNRSATPPKSVEDMDVDTEGDAEVPASLSPRARSATPAATQASESHTDEVGAFALAQLLFVVGHVALKHIVYLELVERELKRRKDEKAKGELPSSS